jgi:hypothetical protein
MRSRARPTPAGSTAKTTFGYDDAGYTTSIAAGTTTDTLNWNATGYGPGQLASVTSGSTTVAGYVYDARARHSRQPAHYER